MLTLIGAEIVFSIELYGSQSRTLKARKHGFPQSGHKSATLCEAHLKTGRPKAITAPVVHLPAEAGMVHVARQPTSCFDT